MSHETKWSPSLADVNTSGFPWSQVLMVLIEKGLVSVNDCQNAAEALFDMEPEEYQHLLKKHGV